MYTRIYGCFSDVQKREIELRKVLGRLSLLTSRRFRRSGNVRVVLGHLVHRRKRKVYAYFFFWTCSYLNLNLILNWYKRIFDFAPL